MMSHQWFQRIRVLIGLAGLLVVFGLSGCGTSIAIEQEASLGGGSPEAVAESFFEDLNRALSDPELADSEVNRAWAERLASYFAPSERADQRAAFATTLATYGYRIDQLDANEQFVIEVVYEGIEQIDRDGDRANVRLVEGMILMRQTRDTGPTTQVTVREQERALGEVLGLASSEGVFPVLRVNGRWFMTEG